MWRCSRGITPPQRRRSHFHTHSASSKTCLVSPGLVLLFCSILCRFTTSRSQSPRCWRSPRSFASRTRPPCRWHRSWLLLTRNPGSLSPQVPSLTLLRTHVTVLYEETSIQPRPTASSSRSSKERLRSVMKTDVKACHRKHDVVFFYLRAQCKERKKTDKPR